MTGSPGHQQQNKQHAHQPDDFLLQVLHEAREAEEARTKLLARASAKQARRLERKYTLEREAEQTRIRRLVHDVALAKSHVEDPVHHGGAWDDSGFRSGISGIISSASCREIAAPDVQTTAFLRRMYSRLDTVMPKARHVAEGVSAASSSSMAPAVNNSSRLPAIDDGNRKRLLHEKHALLCGLREVVAKQTALTTAQCSSASSLGSSTRRAVSATYNHGGSLGQHRRHGRAMSTCSEASYATYRSETRSRGSSYGRTERPPKVPPLALF
eukprot:TRINITY_DN27491_c0_g1_i1.p1 TRINITY_DN27491_c0_g1~~TRINITY_DN27491_c0_g1_i1.p1  ORF type:complete len:270 (-),score=24.07 TRINITY_DN27491_c0_g1_i1:35-844(-)